MIKTVTVLTGPVIWLDRVPLKYINYPKSHFLTLKPQNKKECQHFHLQTNHLKPLQRQHLLICTHLQEKSIWLIFVQTKNCNFDLI